MPAMPMPQITSAKLENDKTRAKETSVTSLPVVNEEGLFDSAYLRSESPLSSVRQGGPPRYFEVSDAESILPLVEIYRNVQYLPQKGTIAAYHSADYETQAKRPKYNSDVSSSASESNQQKERISAYESACRQTKISPNSSFIRQIGNSEICLKNCELTAPDVKAICVALLRDENVSSLDLTSNSIGVKGLLYVIQFLEESEGIDELIISYNWIGAGTLKHFTKFLCATKKIKRLNISGNGYDDKDGRYLAKIIQENDSLEYLNVSRNEFGDASGLLIGPAFANNRRIVTLDLSWNHLRGKGAEAIANAVAQNTTLECLNIAWNGFGFGGTVCMAKALKVNDSLQELNMSNNRIHQKQFLELIDGVIVNQTLRVLKGVVVDREFEEILEEIHKERVFICHYEKSLSVDREKEMEKLKKSTYNIDPVKLLFFMKGRQRAVDLFRELDRDGGHAITREALAAKFKIENIAITSSALDKVFDYFGSKNRMIDLASFIEGERRHRRKTMVERQKFMAAGEEPPEFSSAFFKLGGEVDSKERRLSQAVMAYTQRRRSSVLPERRASGAMNQGLPTAAADGSMDGLLQPKLELPRGRSRSYEFTNDGKDEAFLPPINLKRRTSLLDSSSSASLQRSRRGNHLPTLPAILTETEDNDHD